MVEYPELVNTVPSLRWGCIASLEGRTPGSVCTRSQNRHPSSPTAGLFFASYPTYFWHGRVQPRTSGQAICILYLDCCLSKWTVPITTSRRRPSTLPPPPSAAACVDHRTWLQSHHQPHRERQQLLLLHRNLEGLEASRSTHVSCVNSARSAATGSTHAVAASARESPVSLGSGSHTNDGESMPKVAT